MTTRRLRTGALSLVLVVAASCGNDESTEAAYCRSWEGVKSATSEITTIDVTTDVGDQLQAGVADVDAALTEFREAADEQFGDELADFEAALGALLTTVLSPDLPLDRRTEVQASLDEVGASWNTLVAAVQVECS